MAGVFIFRIGNVTHSKKLNENETIAISHKLSLLPPNPALLFVHTSQVMTVAPVDLNYFLSENAKAHFQSSFR